MQAFGAAADDIREYYRYWREQVWEKRLAPDQAKIAERGKWFNFARGLVWNLGKYYKESEFDSIEGYKNDFKPLLDIYKKEDVKDNTSASTNTDAEEPEIC